MSMVWMGIWKGLVIAQRHKWYHDVFVGTQLT